MVLFSMAYGCLPNGPEEAAQRGDTNKADATPSMNGGAGGTNAIAGMGGNLVVAGTGGATVDAGVPGNRSDTGTALPPGDAATPRGPADAIGTDASVATTSDGGPSNAAAGHGLFTAGAPWYEDVSQASIDPESSQVITGLAARGGWGTGSLRIDFLIDVLQADATVTPRPFTKSKDFFLPDCDFMPVPVPPVGHLEGQADYACPTGGDCHLIVIQGTQLYEMWRANITGGAAVGGTFTGGCMAVWDLTKNYWNPSPTSPSYARGDNCTSADAAGYPIADLLFTADEVKAGEIPHAIRFILPNNRIRKGAYVHPATHSGAGTGAPTLDTVPYGARFRLKKNADLSGLSASAQVVARALQRYGMFLADGGDIALTARSDRSSKTKWSGLLGAGDLTALKVTDFEMVGGETRHPLTLNCNRSPL